MNNCTCNSSDTMYRLRKLSRKEDGEVNITNLGNLTNLTKTTISRSELPNLLHEVFVEAVDNMNSICCIGDTTIKMSHEGKC